MAESVDDPEVFWVDPKDRGILPLDGFHVSRSLKKRLTSGKYQFSANMCFDFVVQSCANRDETWINPKIRDLYSELHQMGMAHSVEVWSDEKLVGGLYGVCIGGVFFGESMFSAAVDGSKLALIALIARLKVGGFGLLDTQFITPHLQSLGCVEIPRASYRKLLQDNLETDADFWKLDANVSPYELWQLSTQTS